MRKKIFKIVAIIVLFAVGALLACDSGDEIEPMSQVYTVEFCAGPGGVIKGKTEQTLSAGTSTEKVIAIADTGYYFAGWADICVLTDETVTESERIIENVSESRYYYALFDRITVQIKYSAGENGQIEGQSVQIYKYGDIADITSSVTAIPDNGYRFVGWSDGVKDATRNEQIVTENKEITANFEIIKNIYTYNYKFADRNCEDKEIALTYGQLENVKLVVPEREHGIFGGWYADKYLTQKVADENGNIVVSNEFFDLDCKRLNAKWITENKHPYKILMVYVTEINAELHKTNGVETVQVDYKMSELERKLCRMITEKISFELNDLAIADFQVSEYFTQMPVTKENMRERHIADGRLDNELWPQNMPELKDMLGAYDSVIVSFSLDDYKDSLSLHLDGGSAISQFANVHFDSRMDQLLYYGGQISDMLDPLHWYWEHYLRTYLHELAHTIELRVNDMPDFHSVVDEYIWEGVLDPLIAERHYFLNKAVVNGDTVGIPYEFWKGNVATVYYEAQEGGYIVSNEYHNPNYGEKINSELQYVLLGNDAIGVTAGTFNGYEFVEWSDGVKTATRRDLNITENLHIYAIFKLSE